MAASSLTAIHLLCAFAHLFALKLVTASLCEESGECGLNGICKLDGDSSICSCPPGFHYFDLKNSSKGCSQDAEQLNRCEATAEMRSIGHFDWSGNDYEKIDAFNDEACEQACLHDCFCTVATYAVSAENGLNCLKKALPLRDGRAQSNITAFVKVYREESQLLPLSPGKERKGMPFPAVIAIIILAGFCFAVAAVTLVIWVFVWRPKLRFLQEAHKTDSEGLKGFTYREIVGATEGFKEELGRGAFGKVYKGVLPDGRAVAVKKLDDNLNRGEEARFGEKEFRTEMIAIGSSHHKNLVQLYGFCKQGLHRMLVYEYMPNGSLDRALFYGKTHLPWEVRVNIALGTARAILYLHEECRSQILHCDIKPQNILLDESYNARLSDFGIAKLVGTEQTWTFTAARGTIGYMAPEWRRGMAVTVKVDVYSFGVMLLEVICYRKMAKADVPDETEKVLSEWAYECFKEGRLAKLMEEQQECMGGINVREFERMVLVGLWCVQDDPSLRPYMKRVVQMLEGALEIPAPPRPGFSS